MVVDGGTSFINLLNNLLLIFVFVPGISSSWGTPTSTGAIKEYVAGRRNLASQNPGYISIHCGADQDYVNEDTGISYKSDKDFINTGINHDITSPELKQMDKDFQRQLSNLRSFPDGRRNCYTLKVKEGRNNSYFIRAFFSYENYDRLNDPPEFDVYLGVNSWITMKTIVYGWVMTDIVSVFQTDTEYVCLVNTGFGIPFISSLELRPLNDDSIYRISSGTLRLVISADAGFPNSDIFRYKDDVYDRAWFPDQFPGTPTINTFPPGFIAVNTSLDIDDRGGGNSYKLPPEVLRTAVQPPNGSTSLGYTYIVNSTTSEFYVYFHFAEIVKLPQGRRREFTITLNGVKYGPYSLEYLTPLSLRPQTSPIQGDVTFTIDATAESYLPPILNAFEIYRVIPLHSSPTHPSDVDAIMAIRDAYDLSRANWQGDPCLPKDFMWTGLGCRFNNTQRITSLNLSESKLTGEISSSVSYLQELESLDLSYNELTGSIPEVLAQLPNLKALYLSGNKLTGVIPQSLKDRSNKGTLLLSNLSESKLTGEISSSVSYLQELRVSFAPKCFSDLSYNELTGSIPEVIAQLPNLKALYLSGNKLTGVIPQSLKDRSNKGTLLLRLDENPDLCQIDPCDQKKKKRLPVAVVAATTSILVFLSLFSVLIIFFRIIRRRQARGPDTNSKKESSLKSRNRPFTYSEIARITANFATVIGEGGFGKVYLGTLDDDTPVAVKLLSQSSKQGYKEFRTEAQLLMIVHHKNLVSLVGYCDKGGNMALIYEYMVNGNLKDHLSERDTEALSWKERLQIAIDAAHGLEYLHNGCKPSIVHRDLKTSNILLTENMQAKIADFGLSRLFSTENASHISTCPAGTPGYLDPEFQASGNLNKKSDVYSFGIILFELITGKPAIMRNYLLRIHIVDWLSPIIQEGNIQSIADPRLRSEFDVNAAWKAVEIAVSCVQPKAVQRPDMSTVLTELKDCMAIEMAVGRTPMTRSGNLLDMSLSHVDSDIAPIAR